VKPSPSSSSAQPEIQEIDALFQRAGLVCNLRGKASGITRRARFERAAPEELSRRSAVPTVAANGVQWLAAPGWLQIPWLWHGFSTRMGGLSRVYCADDAPGELNLGFTAADSREAVAQNRRLLAEAITGDLATPLVTLHQIHSTQIRTWRIPDARQKPCKGDGLMTDQPGVLLGVQTADCIPVLVADRKRRAVAAFHAGWRGTVNRIVETGIGQMRLTFGSRPEDLVAAIGPGIGQCCYAVGEELLSSFESQFSYYMDLFREVYDSDPVRARYPMLFLTQRAPGHSSIGPGLHLDLIEANRRQLLAAGLKPRAIRLVGGCTSCQPELFFSHRASQGHAGRMLGVIGIKKEASRK
jgi:YfiH family protein